MMISTVLFLTSTFAATDHCEWNSQWQCLNDGNCAWYSQCATRPDSSCSPMGNINSCLAKSISHGCVWIGDRTYGHCELDTTCGQQACQSQCSWNPQCTWTSQCGTRYNQQYQTLLCASSGRRIEDEANAAEVASDDEKDDDADSVDEDASDEEEDGETRRLTSNWCNVFHTSYFCNLENHCTWIGDTMTVGFCSPKQSTTCSIHTNQETCGGTGRDGRVCVWSGSPDVGVCHEQAVAPTPSPAPVQVQCGMFYAETSCPAGCQWTGYKCVESDPTPTVHCGMFYAETSCPAGCQWTGWNCVKSDPTPTVHCGMFYSVDACWEKWEHGCSWSYFYSECYNWREESTQAAAAPNALVTKDVAVAPATDMAHHHHHSCQGYRTEDLCTPHSGMHGRQCTWSGSPHSGFCHESEPLPVQCGMFFTASACPTGCYWNGNSCEEEKDCSKYSNIQDCKDGYGKDGRQCEWSGASSVGYCHEEAAPVSCGMLYSASACAAQSLQGCAWWDNKCQHLLKGNVPQNSIRPSMMTATTLLFNKPDPTEANWRFAPTTNAVQETWKACQAHHTADTCTDEYGISGRPCLWSGSPTSGYCHESDPTPSPVPVQCGMFFTASACPTGCQWNGHTCETAPTPSPVPVQCGMFFTASACPTGCQWNGHTCETATTPSPAPVQCGLFYAESACPSGCYWNGNTCEQEKDCSKARKSDDCTGYGKDGRRCTWSGGPTAGYCHEEAAPVSCGMLYSQSACAEHSLHGCAWLDNKCQHRLLGSTQGSSPPDAFFASGAAPAHGASREKRMIYTPVHPAAQRPANAHPGSALLSQANLGLGSTCGLFYTASACPTGCEWTGSVCQHSSSPQAHCIKYRAPHSCDNDSLCEWSGVAQVGVCNPKTTTPDRCPVTAASSGCRQHNLILNEFNGDYSATQCEAFCKSESGCAGFQLGVAHGARAGDCVLYKAGCTFAHNPHWNYYDLDTCPGVKKPVYTCGLFYTESACPSSGCHWNGSFCANGDAPNCSDAINYSDCNYSEGCKWSLTKGACTELDGWDSFCKPMGVHECREWSKECYYNQHHHVCLGNN